MQKNYDVVIIGLGTSGSIAAIKSAKLGLSVLGVERLSQMGGTGTSGGICGYYFGSDGGYYKKINEKLLDIQNEYYIDAPYTLSEPKSIALENEAINSGVEISYNTHIISVKKDGKKVVSATFIKEGQKFEVSAKLFIDTSGNGDFSYLCGCEFLSGKESDNTYMPYTNSLFIANPTPRVLNRDSGLIDMSDNYSYSKELVKSSSQYPFDWTVMGKNATYLKLAPLPGVRESRRVVCEKTVTFEDAIYKNPCNDTIFYAFSNADTHEKCIAFEPDIAKDWYVASGLWGVCMSVAIPMQSLFPKGVKGLLIGGRMLSVDHTLSSVVRMKSDMEKCGEAMAYIAYLAISKNIEVSDISYSDLKPYLLNSGVLDEKNNVGFLNRTKKGLVPFEFSKTIDELNSDLESERETFGIFAAKNIKESADFLAEIQNSNQRKGKIAAIALGRMGDERAIPVLREIAKNRDLTLPISLKMTVPFSISAIYLLGKFKDIEIVPLLKEIISDKGDFNQEFFCADEMFPEKKDLSFQFITHSVASLKEIASFHEDIKDEILEFLKEKFVYNNYSSDYLKLNLKAGQGLKPVSFDYSPIIKNFILS